MAYAVVIGPSAHERIVAASCYYLSPATRLAEVACMVDPDWQGAGLGSILHSGLVEYARPARGSRLEGGRAPRQCPNDARLRTRPALAHREDVRWVIELTMLLYPTDRRTDATANGYPLATRPGSKQLARPLPTSNAQSAGLCEGVGAGLGAGQTRRARVRSALRRSGRIQALSASAGGMPIEPGEQEITAAVEITFMLIPEPR